MSCARRCAVSVVLAMALVGCGRSEPLTPTVDFDATSDLGYEWQSPSGDGASDSHDEVEAAQGDVKAEVPEGDEHEGLPSEEIDEGLADEDVNETVDAMSPTAEDAVDQSAPFVVDGGTYCEQRVGAANVLWVAGEVNGVPAVRLTVADGSFVADDATVLVMVGVRSVDGKLETFPKEVSLTEVVGGYLVSFDEIGRVPEGSATSFWVLDPTGSVPKVAPEGLYDGFGQDPVTDPSGA